MNDLLDAVAAAVAAEGADVSFATDRYPPDDPRVAYVAIPHESPKPGPRPDFLVGPDRWRALAGTRTLLNVHRGGVNRFEWPRALESISNGCVLVSEHSVDVEPLRAGEHFLSGAGENLAL